MTTAHDALAAAADALRLAADALDAAGRAIRAEELREGRATRLPPALLSIPDTARALGLSASGVYRRIEAGELGSVRLGGRRLVPVAEVERLARVEADPAA